jgi:hypothetical protein
MRIKGRFRLSAFQFVQPRIARSVNGDTANADTEVLLKLMQELCGLVSKACDRGLVERSNISGAPRRMGRSRFRNR